MPDPLGWRLRYLDGREVSECDELQSIRLAPRGAVDLILTQTDGTPISRVPLNGCRPVFYRRRSMAPGEASSRLDATVFGRGWLTHDRVEGTLWAAQGGTIVDCPKRLIDEAMVELQVRGN